MLKLASNLAHGSVYVALYKFVRCLNDTSTLFFLAEWRLALTRARSQFFIFDRTFLDSQQVFLLCSFPCLFPSRTALVATVPLALTSRSKRMGCAALSLARHWLWQR